MDRWSLWKSLDTDLWEDKAHKNVATCSPMVTCI